MTGIRPHRAQSRSILAHPDTRYAAVSGTRAQQVETVLFQQPFRMLCGDRKPLFQSQRQSLVGIDQLACHVRLAVDIAGAGVRFDHQIERPLRRLETILRQEAGDIARRHGGEPRHAVDGGSGDQRFRRHQLARRYQKDLRAQSSFIAAILQRTDKRARKRAERGCRHIGHIRIPQRHDTIQLLLRFF